MQSVLASELLFESMRDAAFILDARGRIVGANSAAVAALDRPAPSLLGQDAARLFRIEPHLLQAPGRAQSRCPTITLGERHYDARISPLVPCADPIADRLVVCHDVTARTWTEETLAHQSLHDGLTGLPNRILLADRLQQALAQARRRRGSLALLVLDLDRFKEVNDTLGHQAGDALLQEVAARLWRTVRAVDTVARLGGDEFAIVLPGTRAAGARRIASRILRALEEPVVVVDQPVAVGASIGIALGPQPGDDDGAILRRADVAMYAAKHDQQGFAFYVPEQDQFRPDRLALAAELRQAIAAGGLVLEYQPKAYLRTGTAARVEALVRWPHPRLGLLGPDEFIPLAEHTGLISLVTRWVLGEATRQCSAWRAAGIALDVAVNLSAHDLRDPGLVASVAGALKRHRLPPASLVLEITETSLMADPERAKQVLNSLRRLGVQIAIDDFGAGQTSLAYLKHLPVTQLKIDRSFIRDLLTSTHDAKIVRSAIELAHQLGLDVVAEGVEDAQTWERLSALGCDIAQGYYYSRPLAPEQVLTWFREAAHSASSAAPQQAA